MVLSRRKDGAWGWIVVVSVLLSQTLLGGMCLSGGLFLVIFQSALNSSTITTSWLCSLPITMWFCATPIGSILTNRYGYRTCSFIGGIIAATGISLCYFANSIGFLFMSFGILMGLGFGINYTGCMAAMNVYFDKYKTIVTGIVSIGHNLGLMIYSKFIIYLDDTYGWRGAMLVHGAIAFNLCFFAALMSPLEFDEKEIAKSHGEIHRAGNDVEKHNETNSSSGSLKAINIKYETNKRNILYGTDRSETSLKIEPYKKSWQFEQKETLMETDDHTENVKDDSIEDAESISKFGLFKKSDFSCFCASNILCNISQGIYILHLPPYATDIGFSREDFGLVLTVYGATNVVGKVVYSVLGQHPKIDTTTLYAVSLTATGVCMGLTPIFLSMSGMLTLAGLVGFFYCVTGALILAVVFRIVGYEQFANGLGLSLPFKATGNLIGGPLGGTLFAVTGDYQTSFYIAGVSMVIASLLMIEPVLKHHRNNRPDGSQIQRNRNMYSVCETEIEEQLET